MIATLTRSYVESLNSGAAPTISSAWERVVQGQCSDAYRAAVLHYDKCVGEALERAREVAITYIYASVDEGPHVTPHTSHLTLHTSQGG